MFMDIAIAIAVITGLTQVVKKAGLRTKYVPLAAVVLGIIYAGFIIGWDALSLVSGIVSGLSAVGFYSTVKHTVYK